MTFLPTLAAAAWYHNKLDAELQAKELTQVLDEVEEWALTAYTIALAKGERLSAEETATVAAELSKYTGLGLEFVLGSNLRIDDGQFRKELLRAERRIVGRMDGRYIGFDRNCLLYTSPSPRDA